jgi:hypothetical protein
MRRPSGWPIVGFHGSVCDLHPKARSDRHKHGENCDNPCTPSSKHSASSAVEWHEDHCIHRFGFAGNKILSAATLSCLSTAENWKGEVDIYQRLASAELCDAHIKYSRQMGYPAPFRRLRFRKRPCLSILGARSAQGNEVVALQRRMHVVRDG